MQQIVSVFAWQLSGRYHSR